MFTKKLVNRLKMPTKHIIICEDDLSCQAKMADLFKNLFPPQGDVIVSYVPGGMQAAAIIANVGASLIILDHDMPTGSGDELLKWMKEQDGGIPIITFSGIPSNNNHLKELGAEHIFTKDEVMMGKANELIKEILEGVGA